MSSRILGPLSLSFALVLSVGCDSGDKGAGAGGGAKAAVAKPAADAIEVDAACGTCLFGMDGAGCKLAVQVDGKKYWVSGIDMDDLGDMHASDGMCNTVRRARISGRVEGDQYMATGIELLPAK